MQWLEAEVLSRNWMIAIVATVPSSVVNSLQGIGAEYSIVVITVEFIAEGVVEYTVKLVSRMLPLERPKGPAV